MYPFLSFFLLILWNVFWCCLTEYHLPFRAILLNIILTHDPLGLRVAQTYLNQYPYFLIWHWIHIIRNQHYVEMVKTNIAAICLIFLIIWYKLMVYIFKTILDELFVATSIRATSRVTLYDRRLSNKIYWSIKPTHKRWICDVSIVVMLFFGFVKLFECCISPARFW